VATMILVGALPLLLSMCVCIRSLSLGTIVTPGQSLFLASAVDQAACTQTAMPFSCGVFHRPRSLAT
jgi:hypothetical protein